MILIAKMTIEYKSMCDALLTNIYNRFLNGFGVPMFLCRGINTLYSIEDKTKIIKCYDVKRKKSLKK